MKKTFLKAACFTVAVFILFTTLTACTAGSKTISTTSSTAASSISAAVSTTAGNESVYPLKTDVKLTYWSEMNPNVSANYKNAGDTPFAQELAKRTGIQVEYIHSTTDEAFALLMASNDLPDIIEFWWDAYPGGPSQALKDDQIIALNDIMDEHAPNFTKWLKAHPDVARQIRWDEGYYIGFPCVLGDGKEVYVQYGPQIRKDLLDKLKLSVPETVDEWYSALKGMKDLGVAAPITANKGYRIDFLARAFGIVIGDLKVGAFYIEDGKVVYGPMQPAYKDYLATWRKWYADGLIDKDIATVDGNIAKAKILDGSSAATVGTVGTLYTYNDTAQKNIPGFQMVAAPLPVLKKGDVNKYPFVENQYTPSEVQAVITKQCKHPDIAARLLDYLWSEEGIILANWGIKDKTYTVGVDGKFKYTDFVKNNPDGWTVSRVKGGYMRSYASGPFYQDVTIAFQTYMIPEQFEARDLWTKTVSLEHLLPPMRRTASEDEEFTKIINDVKTYSEECLLKFMMGTMSLDEYDTYTAQMKQLGIDRAIEIMQAAYTRYLAK